MLFFIAVAILECTQVYKISRQNINIFRKPCVAVEMPPNSRLGWRGPCRYLAGTISECIFIHFTVLFLDLYL